MSCTFKLPGEHTMDGITFAAIHHPDILADIKKGIAENFDILVATPPRSGTARILEIVWLLSHNCDFETADAHNLLGRHIFLDFAQPASSKEEGLPVFNSPPPILAKTHLHHTFIDKLIEKQSPKVVVGFRNPKDMLVSLYHFYRMNDFLGKFPGSWDEFFDLYQQGRLFYGCPIDWMLDWWKQKDNKDVLIVQYEDFVKYSASAMVKKIADFLGYSFNVETLNTIAERVSFANMKANPLKNFTACKEMNQEISPYMRRGEVGDWQNYFSEQQNEFIDKKYKEKCEPEGLVLQFN